MTQLLPLEIKQLEKEMKDFLFKRNICTWCGSRVPKIREKYFTCSKQCSNGRNGTGELKRYNKLKEIYLGVLYR